MTDLSTGDYPNRESALKELRENDFSSFIALGSDSGTLHDLCMWLEPDCSYWDLLENQFKYDGEALYNWLKQKHG